MNRIWAPWRINYIQNSKKDKGCLFCRVLKSNSDAKNLVLLKKRYTLAMMNLYPYNNGHLMVAPRRHTASLESLKAAELNEIMSVTQQMKKILDKTLKPDGYNIGFNIGRVGGAGYDKHLHLHIVPRWNGDHNFMPVCADTKIISQSLEALYVELIKRVEKKDQESREYIL